MGQIVEHRLPYSTAHALAAPSGFIEVLDRHRHVTQRLPIAESPLTLGRAYDNDLVVDDPYVCPEHVRMRIDNEQNLVVEDFGSLNGLFCETGTQRVARAVIAPDRSFRVGHTVVRYRGANRPVVPTLVDSYTRSKVWAFCKPALIVPALIISTLALAMEIVFETRTETRVLEIAAGTVPICLFLMLWAGLWALISKLVTEKPHFLAHLAIAATLLVTASIVSAGLGYIAYLLAADDYFYLSSLLGVWAIGSVMFYAHLRIGTRASRRSISAAAWALSLACVAVSAIYDYSDQAGFSSTPRFTALVKPFTHDLVKQESTAAFFARARKLKTEADAQRL
ncbi:MAG: FHA domain-containing protein [Gammaproteobacteria bacterium]